MREAFLLGIRDLGRTTSGIQGKADAVEDASEARFHFIGHCKATKRRPAAELFDTIQRWTRPSCETLDGLITTMPGEIRLKEVMLEVRRSEEDSKAGVLPENCRRWSMRFADSST